MTPDDALLAQTAEELFEEAPCGYLFSGPDGAIVRANRTLADWLGTAPEALAGRRFRDLLSPGGRIYHETHYAPLLYMHGAVREVAFELVRADGSRLPVLVTSVASPGEDGRPRLVRTTVFDATDRRRYEQELLRARRREQDIALLLQRSLLAGALPEVPGLALEVAYRPAVRGLEVGGDWYDAFPLDGDGTVGLVVGDVVGKGIDAAAAMGQLRSAVRALATTGLGPARLLEALDGYVRRHDVGRMATVVYARLDVPARRLAWACAGHPPPVLLAPGAPPAISWEGRSLPLDGHPLGPAPRTEAEAELAPGGGVLLYTDGLVERRSRPIDAGLDELLAAVGDAAVPVPAATLADRLRDPEHPDDVCLVVARLAGGGSGDR